MWNLMCFLSHSGSQGDDICWTEWSSSPAAPDGSSSTPYAGLHVPYHTSCDAPLPILYPLRSTHLRPWGCHNATWTSRTHTPLPRSRILSQPECHPRAARRQTWWGHSCKKHVAARPSRKSLCWPLYVTSPCPAPWHSRPCLPPCHHALLQ